MPKQTASKKKRVGRARICSPKYLMQIFPEWLHPPVRSGFWQSKKNRRDYLLWLAHKLGYERMGLWGQWDCGVRAHLAGTVGSERT